MRGGRRRLAPFTTGRFALTLFDPVSSEIHEILETYETTANLPETRVLRTLRAFRGFSAAPTNRRWGAGGRRFKSSRSDHSCSSGT
jgi:hypothetical protein